MTSRSYRRLLDGCSLLMLVWLWLVGISVVGMFLHELSHGGALLVAADLGLAVTFFLGEHASRVLRRRGFG